MNSPALPFRSLLFLSLCGILVLVTACRPPEATKVAKTADNLPDLKFVSSPIGAAMEGRPWITYATALDLDHDGLIDVLACDCQKNCVVWLRQTSPGQFKEICLLSNLPAPVHIAAVDIDGDGDLDLLIACMGQVLPTNERIGSVVILENDGHQNFTRHDIEVNTARVTDVEAGDFNGDGRLDLAVGKFGYEQGEITWLENLGDWKFASHPLLSLPGTVNVCVADLNGDHFPDITAVVSQQYEEIYLFENDGAGHFTKKTLFGSTNEDFGSSGISLCDLNRDGRLDILYTNGDGFDYAEPGSRPWHGVQWLENLGDGNFKYHRIGDLAGAYSPVGVDLDGDGAIDVVCVSGIADPKNPAATTLVVFHNDGRQNFTRVTLARTPTNLITVAAADLDGNGHPDLITGGFHANPPFDHMSRILLWRRQ